jgi:heavy metal sensor kinase
MSLTARLSAFFLSALALVLVGFSVVLYLLAGNYLDRQMDGRLDAALETLAAAAEFKDDWVEWEPQERRLLLGQDVGPEQVRWTIHDDRGKPIDHSRNLDAADPLALLAQSAVDKPISLWRDGDGRVWRLGQRRLQGDRSGAVTVPEPNQYPSLVLTAALSQAPVAAALRNLALALLALSGGSWLLAVFLGRWFCRQALVPVTRMALFARSLRAADLDQRLPDAKTGDELADLGQAFNDLLARLHDSFERQRRFTGDASHQLRTPLAAILGQIDVALRRERAPEEYRRVLGLIHDQTEHLHQIVEMLLFLSRAEAETALPRLENVDLAAWLPDHLKGWSTHARAADLRLDMSAGGPFWAKVHTPLLGQLLNNLLDNACKYSEPGTPITLRLRQENGKVLLAVQDLGRGIAPDDQARVFEPFFRSAQARSRGDPGVGLGLAVARRIATALGGTLTLQSQPGYGSEFTLHLPATLASNRGGPLEDASLSRVKGQESGVRNQEAGVTCS